MSAAELSSSTTAGEGGRRVVLLALLALACCVAFMTINLRGNLAFALELRGMRLAAMVTVGVAIAVSTVLFQTITANRILTPSIMGLDALYICCQTALVFAMTGFGYAGINPVVGFATNFAIMLALALALFLPMLNRRMDLGLMLLAGVVLGVLFRSITNLLARLIDPNDFAVLQGAVFASFNAVRADTLAVAIIITVIGAAVAWSLRYRLDVFALGRDVSTGLGLSWSRSVTGLLVLVAALVAAATALVGPIAFLGLLVAALAHKIVNSERHAVLLPAAALVAVIVLVGGQTLLQHVFGGEGTLSIVVELVGGIVFLTMLFSGMRR